MSVDAGHPRAMWLLPFAAAAQAELLTLKHQMFDSQPVGQMMLHAMGVVLLNSVRSTWQSAALSFSSPQKLLLQIARTRLQQKTRYYRAAYKMHHLNFPWLH